MKLYRGDYYKISTQPGRYRADGIRSKSFGKGVPQYVEPEKLMETILKHIDPKTKKDIEIYKSTEYISFSTSEKRAMYWLSSKGSQRIIPIDEEYAETHYLFTLDIDESELHPVDDPETIFRFSFKCNPKLKRPNSNSDVEHAMFNMGDTDSWVRTCPLCNGNYPNHSILLIDTQKYLKSYPNALKTPDALFLAQEDQEWLVLPINPMGKSHTSIPRADFWNVQHFISEIGGRDKNHHQMMGQEFP